MSVRDLLDSDSKARTAIIIDENGAQVVPAGKGMSVPKHDKQEIVAALGTITITYSLLGVDVAQKTIVENGDTTTITMVEL